MKISKVFIFSICLFLGLFFSFQSTLADDTASIIIRKDDDPLPPPSQPHLQSMMLPVSDNVMLPVSVGIDDVQLVLYFDWSVGNATITVYDASNNVIHQETVDTDYSLEVYISSSSWSSGSYYVTINYGTNHLIGDFEME